MRVKNASIVARVVALTAPAILASSASAYNTYTITFQQGVNGYTSQTERMFRTNDANRAGGAGPSGVNATTHAGGQIAVDGWDNDDGSSSPDQQIFLKFDNIIGSGAGQIPANAFVLDASLTLTTGAGGSDDSGGPLGVGAVLVPWNTTTSTYNNLKPAGSPVNGLSSKYGAITPAVGFYDDPKVRYGGNNKLNFDEVATTSVAPLVRDWINGTTPNYGFTIHAGAPSATADAWAIAASNNYTVANRPKLSITYTDAPVQTVSFQQGVNGYSGTTMAWLRDKGETTDGSTFDHAFLDGWSSAPIEDDVSADDHALVKFNNIFTTDGGSVPEHAVITKAYLKVTTSDVGNAQTGEVYEAHQMLVNWDASTKYTQFSGLGPRPGIHETAESSANYGMIPLSDVYFEVTDAVTSWQNGAPNYGFDIRASEDPDNPFDNPNGTHDGWSIYFTGASDITKRPELLISYFLHLPGDANDNGKIDFDDFALIDRGFAKGLTTWAGGDFNYDGVVDAADYLIIDAAWAAQGGHPLDPGFLAAREAQFGAGYAAALVAAVPEPASVGLLAASLPLAFRRRRRA